MTEFGLDDVGGILKLTVKEDGAITGKNISDATLIRYLIKKPDEVTAVVTAGFDTNGTNGKVAYAFIANDLDLIGLYEVQVEVTTPSYTATSSSYLFTVRDTLTVTI